MATRSRIGIVNDNGTVTSIYCHWDGYISNNGKILLEHYTDKEKVEKLISLGSISSLARNVDPDPKGGTFRGKYNPEKDEYEKKPAKGVHTFDSPQEGVVVAYHRDRGEDWEDVKPREDKSVKDFIDGDWEEYGYLFVDGAWYCVYMDYKERGDGKWKAVRRTVKLTKEFCERYEDKDYTPKYTDIPDGK